MGAVILKREGFGDQYPTQKEFFNQTIGLLKNPGASFYQKVKASLMLAGDVTGVYPQSKESNAAAMLPGPAALAHAPVATAKNAADLSRWTYQYAKQALLGVKTLLKHNVDVRGLAVRMCEGEIAAGEFHHVGDLIKQFGESDKVIQLYLKGISELFPLTTGTIRAYTPPLAGAPKFHILKNGILSFGETSLKRFYKASELLFFHEKGVPSLASKTDQLSLQFALSEWMSPIEKALESGKKAIQEGSKLTR